MHAIGKRLRRLEERQAASSAPETLEELYRHLAMLLAKTTQAKPAEIEKALPEWARNGTLRRIAVEAELQLRCRRCAR